MTFLIADTFTDSLARLTNDEQKAAKTTAFDLQMNAASPGLRFHRLDKAKDKNFWSVRVNADLRIVVHRTGRTLLLCYVDHHDKAYSWAERRKLEAHPRTGAAQFVEIRERVQEVLAPTNVEPRFARPQRPPVFASFTDDELLGHGVPVEWLDDVRRADEDDVLILASRLPAEAGEALLELATGGAPHVLGSSTPLMAMLDVESVARSPEDFGGRMPEHPFLHADAQRRFRVVSSVEELQRALDAPWDKWAVFLHPEQRQIVERDYNGPARVSGSAGTGKTIVALHRAAHMARRSPGARVLVATFSDPLANALRAKLARLVGNEPRIAERIEVFSLDALAVRLYAARFGRPRLIPRDGLKKLLEEAANGATQPFPVRFLLSEWEQVVDAWQLATWEAYRDVPRLGRRVRLPEARRAVLWDIFSRVRVTLTNRGLSTRAGLFESLSADLAAGAPTPFNFAVIDEAQDLSVSQMRFLGALGGNRPNALFLAGDIGQRIFQQPFSWKALGVDVRGRSRTLRVNYRTSHQIREQADRLLDRELVDADGVTEDRSRTISVFNGPPPLVRVFETQEQESRAVGAWLAEQTAAGLQSHEIGLFVRSEAQLPRAESAVKAAGLQYRVLDEQIAVAAGQVSLGTMHLAKGLEFRAVAVMACDDEILPLQSRIESVGDDGDLEEVYETERHLLYVACTRARDLLSVSGVMPVSEFLDDLRVTRRPGGVTS